jgi:hypothetical protein
MKCEDYLTARGISLQTVKEYRLEFDDAPDKGRIVDRLGDDILVAGGRSPNMLRSYFGFLI